jgi:hypothetical protein
MTPTTKDTFVIWHGSQRWSDEPEIRAAKKGRAEWGAGIYGSTHFETCGGYAKGSGKVRLLEVQKSRVLEKSAIPMSTALDFVNKFVPRSRREEILEDCNDLAERIKSTILNHRSPVGSVSEGELWLPAATLRNLMVNYDLSSGVRGVSMAEFFAGLGIGLSLDTGGSKFGEHWLVIYDPRLIVSWDGHTYESALEIGHVLPKPDAHSIEPVVYQRASRRQSSPTLGW